MICAYCSYLVIQTVQIGDDAILSPVLNPLWAPALNPKRQRHPPSGQEFYRNVHYVARPRSMASTREALLAPPTPPPYLPPLRP